MPSLRVIGPGRAGLSLMRALAERGWSVTEPVGRGGDHAAAAEGVDLLVIATPDAAIAEVAAAVRPVPTTVVAHLSGALGMDALSNHARRACLHPLVAMPDAERGAESLVGAWFAISGDPLVRSVVADLHGHPVELEDEQRAAYHAAACIASNHLVGVLGQAERVAASVGVPFEAYHSLVRATVDNVERLGPTAALTGPVSRGDWDTIERHLDAIAEEERAGYCGGAVLAGRLVGRDVEVPACR